MKRLERQGKTRPASKTEASLFELGDPIDAPPLAMRMVMGDDVIRRHRTTGHLVVTKVDPKRGVVTLSSVAEAERCGTTASGFPLFAIGSKPR